MLTGDESGLAPAAATAGIDARHPRSPPFTGVARTWIHPAQARGTVQRQRFVPPRVAPLFFMEGVPMFQSRWWRVLGRHVAGLAVAVGAFGPAHADYVTGTWDPEFGVPFNGLSWRGKVLADIPADCSQLPAGIRLLSSPGCSTPWTTVSAVVEFFDTNTPSEVLETLDFTATVTVNLLNVNGQGVIDGLGTANPDPGQVVVAPGTGLDAYGVPVGTGWGLKLEFVAGQTEAILYWISPSAQPCSDPDLLCFEGRNNPDLPALVVVQEIPEPAPLMLALPALLGLAFVGRRRIRR